MASARRICVVGAGLAGLSAAHDLGRRGHEVVVVESSPEVGGLASSIVVAGRPVERFYHFVCRNDDDLIALAGELGVADRLHWRQAGTSFLYRGRLHRFGSPLDLLRFTPVPLTQRLRFGLNIVSSRYRRSWRRLDRLPARAWLTQRIGRQAYEVIWDPLLRIKFGDAHDQVSAAWIWHRIHRVAASRRRIWEREHLGYLERGSATVVEALCARLRDMGTVTIRTGVAAERLRVEDGRVTGVDLAGEPQTLACDAVLSTIALPLLARLVPELAPQDRLLLEGVRYLGVVCVLLLLRQRVTDSFWININDPRTPFNGLIEYSNLNRHLGLGERAVVYLPQYLEPSHPRFALDDERLLAESVDCLRCLDPAFDSPWIEEAHVFREAYAQAICTVGFAERIPSHRGPVRGLYLTDSTQFYPEDRTVSAAIRLGRRVAVMISEDSAQAAEPPTTGG